jgi:hypothetical protein
MNSSRRLRFGLSAAVLLLVTAAVTWHSFAAPPGNEPAAGLGGQGLSPGAAVPASAAPVPGGPGFYSLSAMFFRPYLASPSGYAYTGGDLYNPGTTLAAYEGPVSVPNRATMTRLVAYYWDGSVTEYVNVNLYRISLDTGSVELLAEVYSTGNAGRGSVETTSIAQPVIDQQSHAYAAEVQIPGNVSTQIRFVGLRIDYAFTTDLPLVTN